MAAVRPIPLGGTFCSVSSNPECMSVLIGFRPVYDGAFLPVFRVSQVLPSFRLAKLPEKNIENLRNFTRALASGLAGRCWWRLGVPLPLRFPVGECSDAPAALVRPALRHKRPTSRRTTRSGAANGVSSQSPVEPCLSKGARARASCVIMKERAGRPG
jgi:hypothetical protein